MIDKILAFINKEYNGENFYAKEFLPDLYFGIDHENNIACIKKNNRSVETTKIKTNYIELFQNVRVILELNSNQKVEDNFNIIICKSNNNINRETFIKLCFNFYNDEMSNDVFLLTQSLIELFQMTSTKDIELEKGIWSELFAIYFINKHYDFDISNFWHSDYFLKYDFSLNDRDKIEVKSTNNEVRIHHFSHEQLYTNNKVLVASVLLRKDDEGLTVFDLFNKVRSLFDNNYEKIIRYEKELRRFNANDVEKFSLSYAEENIKFFFNDEIPRFNMNEPDGVYRTTYDVDLSNIESLNKEQIMKFLSK